MTQQTILKMIFLMTVPLTLLQAAYKLGFHLWLFPSFESNCPPYIHVPQVKSQLQPLHTERDVPQVPWSSTLQSIHSILGQFDLSI